jgi:hypothetical protein
MGSCARHSIHEIVQINLNLGFRTYGMMYYCAKYKDIFTCFLWGFMSLFDLHVKFDADTIFFVDRANNF